VGKLGNLPFTTQQNPWVIESGKPDKCRIQRHLLVGAITTVVKEVTLSMRFSR
jgi:hypothetical protein